MSHDLDQLAHQIREARHAPEEVQCFEEAVRSASGSPLMA
jgi:hypothetical protein